MDEENKNVVESNESEENKVVLEFSTIQNGVETKQAQVNDVIKPTVEKKGNLVVKIAAIVIILGIVIIIGFFTFAAKKAEASTGEVQNSQMKYSNPKEGQIVYFPITNKLVMQMTIKKIEDLDGVKIATFDLNVKGHKDKIIDCSSWINNDVLSVSFKSIGDSFIYISDDRDIYNGFIINVFNKDGQLHLLKDFDEHSGLSINNIMVKEDALILEVSRVDITETYVRYDDNQEENDSNVGLSICKEKIQDLDQEIMVSAFYTYRLVNNELDLENGQYDSYVSLGDYILYYKPTLCQ